MARQACTGGSDIDAADDFALVAAEWTAQAGTPYASAYWVTPMPPWVTAHHARSTTGPCGRKPNYASIGRRRESRRISDVHGGDDSAKVSGAGDAGTQAARSRGATGGRQAAGQAHDQVDSSMVPLACRTSR